MFCKLFVKRVCLFSVSILPFLCDVENMTLFLQVLKVIILKIFMKLQSMFNADLNKQIHRKQ